MGEAGDAEETCRLPREEFVRVRRKDLERLTTEVMQIRDFLPRILQGDVLHTAHKLRALESNLERKERELEQLRADCEHFRARLQAAQAEGLRERKEKLAVRRQLCEARQQLERQAAYCTEMGAAACTLLWGATSSEDVVKAMLAADKALKFFSITGQTMESFVKSLDGDVKELDSDENQFVFALAGIVTRQREMERGGEDRGGEKDRHLQTRFTACGATPLQHTQSSGIRQLLQRQQPGESCPEVAAPELLPPPLPSPPLLSLLSPSLSLSSALSPSAPLLSLLSPLLLCLSPLPSSPSSPLPSSPLLSLFSLSLLSPPLPSPLSLLFPTDVAAIACGREFLVSSSHVLLDTILQLLGDLKPGQCTKLKVLLLMCLYNMSINLKGLRYMSESPGFIPLLWWLLSDPDAEVCLHALRLAQSLVLEPEVFAKAAAELRNSLPLPRILAMTKSRNPLLQTAARELLEDLQPLGQHP